MKNTGDPSSLLSKNILLCLVLFSLALSSACSRQPAGALRQWVTQSPSPTPFRPMTTPLETATGAAEQAQPAAVSTSTATIPAGEVQAVFRSGQTFITWRERADLQGETYRIYRANHPIDAAALAQAQFLAAVGKDSARFYANSFTEDGQWKTRFSERLITQDGAAALAKGTGLLVWTLSPADLDGQTAGAGYYAVTVTPPNGAETLTAGYTTGPVVEEAAEPLPVEITSSSGVKPGAGAHIYIQYMDLRHWNATFHAPNPTNQYYGLNPQDPNLAQALAYAYDYVVFTPEVKTCGGSLPKTLPVLVYLHGWKGNRYVATHDNSYPYCAYLVYPTDELETWYFGFARSHDYRKGGVVSAGDVIENYTEQRILRMVYDLQRSPPGPPVDTQRLYVFGHSMGGTGALGLALRYPNVFAAVYSGEPITNFLTAGVTHEDWAADAAIKWGAPELNLPVALSAPGGWAAPLQKYNGLGVWDWQDFEANFSPSQPPDRAGDDLAPLGIDSGLKDHVITWKTQGALFYPLLHTSPAAIGGVVTDLDHDWSNFAGLLPTLGLREDAPFWGLRAIRAETVPGLSLLSSNPGAAPSQPTGYNQTILWSASWAAWDGAPVDQPDEWRMSFCSVQPGGQVCGTGAAQTVSITPRRVQQFHIQPGAQYDWENRLVGSNRRIASGTVTVGEDGLLTVPNFAVSPSGNRLVIKPHQS